MLYVVAMPAHLSGSPLSAAERAITLAAELIRIRSDEQAGELAAAELAADRLESAGLDVALLPFGDGRRNVVARLEGAGERPVCLSGHVDVVGADPAAWSRDPWDGAVEDGALHGRGASDMKGAVAAIIVAAEAWAATDPARRPPLLVVLSGGEETGCLGAQALAAAGALEPASVLIVPEPTSCRPLIGHRGGMWLRAELHGRPAHASAPHLGHSAVRDAAAAILAFDAIEHRSDDLLGASTLSVGRIAGGVAVNVVPAHCTLDIDVRTLPGETGASWSERLRSALGPDAVITTMFEMPAVRSDPDAPALLQAAAALGLPRPAGAAPYITDASVLAAALDAPVLLWGPGDLSQAHAVDERCSVDQIGDVAERLAALPRAWADARV
jgi:succinyl-diaminopimelate desuccinylase